MKIGIVGNGVVGNALARAFMEFGEVRAFDKDKARSTHTLTDVLKSNIIFLCLPTPQMEGSLSCDLSAIIDFCETLKAASVINDLVLDTLPIVIRSTVPIGTTDKLREEYGLKNMIHSPEFLTARCAVTDAQIPSRNIIGGYITHHNTTIESMSSRVLASIYETRFKGIPILKMKPSESEAVKLFQNSFFSVKVSFFNEIRALADKLQLNWNDILRGMLTDGRIAHSHTKAPGPDGKYGYGGACLIPNTPILVEDGWAYLSSINVGDKIYDDKGLTTVTGKSSRIVNNTVTLIAKGRVVTGSEDHIHYTYEHTSLKEKKLGDFKVGDYIFIPHQNRITSSNIITNSPRIRYTKTWKDKIEWTPDLAWILGLWLADGYISSSTAKDKPRVGWTLGGHESDLASKVVMTLRDLGISVNYAEVSSEGTYGRSNILLIKTQTKWFISMMHKLGLVGDCYTKRAPLNCPYPESLIGGWLDGDGSYSGGVITAHSESVELINDFDRLLLSVGVCASIGRKGKKIYIGDRTNVKKVCNWAERFIFDDGRYLTDTIYASTNTIECKEGWAIRVNKILNSINEESEVIAIETESGRYIANNQLTHNCLPKDIANLVSCMYEAGVDPKICNASISRNKEDREKGTWVV